ncbi:MAG: AlpA family phage regulatory protein [Hyphomonas sp.]|nr:AlpA family phage regulatory protein [Hyphomonas sp.]
MSIQLIPMKQLCDRCGICPSTAYKLRRTDSEFPQPVMLGQRLVRYKLSDVERYIEIRQQRRLAAIC